MLVKKLMEKSEDLFDEAISEDSVSKAFISGAIEGYIEAAVLCLPVLFVGVCYWQGKAKQKK